MNKTDPEIQKRRTVFRHPLTAVGGAIMAAGIFLFFILLMYDITSGDENPYRSLVSFVAAPAIVVIGLMISLLSIWIQVRRARKRGEDVKFTLSIDTSDPRYMKNLWRFLALTSVLVFVIAYGGTRAYEATDSVGFCGKTCHEVMEPQFVTYHNSPHAKVLCAECHIGPGASFWVKAKVDGIRQVFATMLDSYSRPIETPVHNLRPAQQTCEHCHWPRQFYGDKFLTRTYYRTDEENSPWTISMRVKIGGGNPRSGKLEGIHYHMLTQNIVEYVAADEKRQIIPWMRVITPDGDTAIYTSEDEEIPEIIEGPEGNLRRFDCMDCHNRPSHKFQPPAVAINLALNMGTIASDLPYVRATGVELINAEYATKPEALDGIATGLRDYYAEEYPEIAEERADDIERAITQLQTIYADNFFPEMHTDYRVRENNLSHFVNDGCFRCHQTTMVNRDGNSLATDCRTCHVIVAQGPSEQIEDLEMNLAGLEFHHPEDIDEAWKEMLCTECHDSESGY
ncbi:MAG: NapC/NirT family cytochrome c [bacterium]